MVKIIFTYKDNKIQKLEMSGHAMTNDPGKDLVCAGLTAIVTGAMNAFDLNYQKNIEIIVKNNNIQIINRIDNKNIQTMFEMLRIQLQTIAVQYPKNAKLKEVH